MAFLDDIYVAVTPQRVRPRIHLNQGKARVWNAAGVWVGNLHLPATHQTLTVLGAPVGSPMFAQHQLQHTLHTHQQLLQRIPHRHWGLPPMLVADHGHPSHILGHSAPAPHTRRPRPHVSNNSRSPRTLPLGFCKATRRPKAIAVAMVGGTRAWARSWVTWPSWAVLVSSSKSNRSVSVGRPEGPGAAPLRARRRLRRIMVIGDVGGAIWIESDDFWCERGIFFLGSADWIPKFVKGLLGTRC